MHRRTLYEPRKWYLSTAGKYESIAARLGEVDVENHGVSVDSSSPSERIRRVETNCAACQPVRGVDYFYAKMVFVDC